MADAVDAVLAAAAERRPVPFRLVNAHSVYSARTDHRYADILSADGVNFIDGRPLALVMRVLNPGRPVNQVRGPDLFEHCLDAGRTTGVRHFFLGSTPEVLAALRHQLSARYPALRIAGAFSPPFRTFTDEDRQAFAAAVRETQAHVVWVGLGTPKQDLEAAWLARALGIPCVAVGAAFDFSAGNKRPAPRLVTSLGLEWLFRLVTEPRRLWRRYLLGNPYFLALAAREMLTTLPRRPRRDEP